MTRVGLRWTLACSSSGCGFLTIGRACDFHFLGRLVVPLELFDVLLLEKWGFCAFFALLGGCEEVIRNAWCLFVFPSILFEW